MIDLREQPMAWTYKIDGGDGDQSYFSTPLILELAAEDWFDGKVRRGDAELFRVKQGQHRGTYVALTSRVLESTEGQLERQNIASVVVHIIRNPTASFDGSDQDAEPIGMSFVERTPCT